MAKVTYPPRKKVDATLELILQDPTIEAEWKILQNLQHAVRRNIPRPGSWRVSIKRPSLYKSYRTVGFPLKDNGEPLRKWRRLSPWMKAQIAANCLMSSRCKAFTLRLHDQLLEELTASGNGKLKEYIRDRINRCLRDEFGEVPWFMFVIENRSKSGRSYVRPHVHGMVQILPADPKRLKSGEYCMASRVKIHRHGLEEAKFHAGEEVTREAMKLAAGDDEKRPSTYKGQSQMRCFWWKKMYFKFFNPEWISYAFKNAHYASRMLPDNRLVMSRPLNQEAQRLWKLISMGEAAIDDWP